MGLHTGRMAPPNDLRLRLEQRVSNEPTRDEIIGYNDERIDKRERIIGAQPRHSQALQRQQHKSPRAHQFERTCGRRRRTPTLARHERDRTGSNRAQRLGSHNY